MKRAVLVHVLEHGVLCACAAVALVTQQCTVFEQV